MSMERLKESVLGPAPSELSFGTWVQKLHTERERTRRGLEAFRAKAFKAPKKRAAKPRASKNAEKQLVAELKAQGLSVKDLRELLKGGKL